MSKLPIFNLEDYLSAREFSAPFMLGGSDSETHSLGQILDLADSESRKLWDELSLHYTEPYGMPLLLEEIAGLYGDDIEGANILSFAGAEEGIYCLCHALLEPTDHAIVVTPCYQSLESVPSSLCEVTEVGLDEVDGWELHNDRVIEAIKPTTKLLLINYPHNPTGAVITKTQQEQLVEIARTNDIWIFSDEVYRNLELEPSNRLPTMASIYEKGISLGVMSKSFGLPGLRVGWIAAQSRQLLSELSNVKHYLSICNSAPSEVLALIALRSQDKILARNLEIIQSNIALLDRFFSDQVDLFAWTRPKAGCIGFPKIMGHLNSDVFAEKLLNTKGVLVVPASVFNLRGNFFRIGFGRKNMPDALRMVRDFIEEEI
ncbi:MAG: aminotransferase class I/II-fold pyridoxal phosphate-dependent enzyme [Cellvibrionales bacterium TMED148]|nr:aminotransferase [Porticoccaceae bacterium]RPG90989.1 MAG: aminotransferase class I/II-fold pyridoxal phosphate-dependent enzyme [Cellvibrionales bacterium TMED148]